MNNLNNYLRSKNIYNFEGHTQQVQPETNFLKNIVDNPNIKNVMEIGFNAGHSAETFLSTNKNINLISFDIGDHDYLIFGKEFIDNTYPNRHELIIGDSLKTIPEFVKNNDTKFDIIFIDGGHTYTVVKNDTEKSFSMLSNKGIILWHDYAPGKKSSKDIVKYLGEISKTKQIFHIENTSICYFQNNF